MHTALVPGLKLIEVMSAAYHPASAHHLATHLTGLAIRWSFIINPDSSPVKSGVRLSVKREFNYE